MGIFCILNGMCFGFLENLGPRVFYKARLRNSFPEWRLLSLGSSVLRRCPRQPLTSGAECQCNVRNKLLTAFQLLQTEGILNSPVRWKQRQKPNQYRMPCLKGQMFQLKYSSSKSSVRALNFKCSEFLSEVSWILMSLFAYMNLNNTLNLEIS